MKSTFNYIALLLFALASCGQPPAFVEDAPGSNAIPTNIPIGGGGKIDDNGENPDDTDDIFDPDKELHIVGQNFTAGSPISNSLGANLNDPFVSSNLSMERAYYDRSLNFKQVNRPNITDPHTQGHPASAHRDTIYQNESDQILDILIVVDNSGSMYQEQQNLSTKLNPLLQEVAGTNWRIGITTTDPSHGCINEVIYNDDADPAQKFADAIIDASVYGSGNERGVLQSVNGLKGECLENPWVRNDSSVAVLIISDEDNCSQGSGCGSNDYGQASYLTDYLSSIRVLGVNSHVYGLVYHPSQTNAQCPTGAHKANQYASIITQTNGTWGSICDSDYSNTLEAISSDIATSLNTQFTLTHLPVGPVTVYVDGVLQPAVNYTVNQKIVEFTSNAPAEGAKVEFDYNFDNAPILTSFALSKDPSVDTLKVYVAGVLASAIDYNYAAGTNSVDFVAAPTNNALIEIRYRENSPALTQYFYLTGDVSEPSVQVLVNGVVQSAGYTYFSGAKKVYFNPAPPDNADIIVNYQEVGEPILAYAFSVDPDQIANLEVKDAISGTPIDFDYTAGSIVFDESDWVENRDTVVIYPNPGHGELEVTLPQTPIAGTVSASDGTITCNSPALTVVGNVVQLAGCNFPIESSAITIDYLYIPAGSSTFVFTPSIPVPLEEVIWEVSIDNVITSAYTRSETTFTFNSPISGGATVKLVARYYQ